MTELEQIRRELLCQPTLIGLIGYARVLYRHHEGAYLYAIPYDMKSNQSPLDLWNARNIDGWLWLCSPGWFGAYNVAAVKTIRSFLDLVGDSVPDWPGEFSTCDQWLQPLKNQQLSEIRSLGEKR